MEDCLQLEKLQAVLVACLHVCQQVSSFQEHVLLSKELLGMRQELESEAVDVFELAWVHK